MEEHNILILETVKDLLSRGEIKQAARTVGDLQPADAAEVLPELGADDEIELLVNIDPRQAARALLEMDEGHQVEVAGRLRTGELRGLLARMPVDEAVDLLGDIPESQRTRLLKLFGRQEADELERLLAYGDHTAGGLMTPDYIAVKPEDTADEVIRRLRGVSPDVETIYYVYVVGDDRELRGVLSLRELIVSPPDGAVGEIMKPDVLTVSPEEDQERVAEVISKYDLLALPVVDGQGRMLGIVTVDDVMEVIGDEAEEDLLRFAGASVREEEAPGLMSDLGRRVPWFILAVIIEVLAAGGILKIYSPLFEEFLVLVFFIPLLVTMGGNIAVQSSTVMGRWLASGAPPGAGTARAVTGEVGWGVLVGAVTGGVVALIAFSFGESASIGLVVGLSLGFTVIAASMVGCALPVTLSALRRHPGGASGPLLGTTMDVLSLAIYLAIGRLLLR